MNKFFKFLSATLAGCMMMTMFAGAANLNAVEDEPETETLTGTAYHVTADGTVKSEFEYTVPVDSTEDERSEIARQAAREAAGLDSVGRSARSSVLLADDEDVPLLRSKWTRVPTFNKFASSSGYVEVDLTGIETCSTVQVEVNNVPETAYISEDHATVVFYDGEYIEIVQGNSLYLRVKGSPNGSAARVQAFQVY